MTMAIHTVRSAHTYVLRNDAIVVATPSGSSMAAAIADISISAPAAFALAPGNSSDLRITDNHAIVDNATFADCGSGPAVAAGIVLYGTGAAVVRANGLAPSTNVAFGAIMGGAAVATNTTVTPSQYGAAGLWLINTSGATVTNNEIRAGYYPTGCSATAATTAVAYRETTLTGGSSSRTGTTFDANGASCALPPSYPASPDPVAGCAAVLVEDAASASAPLLTNNILAAGRGQHLMALWQQRGSGVRALNNLFDVGLTPLESAVGGPTRSAILLDHVSSLGIQLANNILLVRDTADASAVALRVLADDDSGTPVPVFDHNLLFIDGDDLSTTNSPVYALVGSASYTAATINSKLGIANIVADPALAEPPDAWSRSRARLSAVSPARGTGQIRDGLPDHDIDGQARPSPLPNGASGTGLVCIGHDEFYP